MCNKNELDQILKKLTSSYYSVYGNRVVRILLYGSYARGDNSEYSDVDVVALVHGEREELQKKLQEVWDVSSELELECETILSPTVIPYEEFEKYLNDIPYYKNIEKEGVEIGRS